jgi:hypothetical protein
MPGIKDVTVHVDPEDDEINPPSLHLPSRKLVEQNLLVPWSQQIPQLQAWVIHYLAGSLTLDLYATAWTPQTREQLILDCQRINYSVLLRFFLTTTPI